LKLVIRDFLASLKEREELDAILPDLLSSLGFTVYSRPQRGTVQHGVDIAAVGNDDHGEEKVFLFSVKQGDLTRQEWDAPLQGLRSSLNEIRDAYITSRIPPKYKDLKIVVCLCFGGDIQEQVRPVVTGYMEQNTTDRISYEEWNGDKIAGLLLRGILREEILPKQFRTNFQKAVAVVDQPETAYFHFKELTQAIVGAAGATQTRKVVSARQLYVCLWILFVWARDIDNVEAPYRASELVLLSVWHLTKSFIGKRSKDAQAITRVLHQLIQLHMIICGELLERKLLPHVGTVHAISMAVRAHNALDVNLKLFDVLGRFSLFGLWLYWSASYGGKKPNPRMEQQIARWRQACFALVQNNPALLSPMCDEHAIEIGLFLQLCLADSSTDTNDIRFWLREITNRIDFTVRSRGRYPCIFTDYRDLVEHPRDRSDEYLKEATSGSVLIPVLAAWLSALHEREFLQRLTQLVQSELSHCTLQLWLPDDETELNLYLGRRDHGIALSDLPLSGDGEDLLDIISKACEREQGFQNLSPNQTGYWPIILLACRHHRLPIPPHFWIGSLRSPESQDGASPSES
jgi:hypothetical protein